MILVEGMYGLGDNIFQVPIIRHLCLRDAPERIFLRTPWPQLYDEGRPPNLFFTRPATTLRTQVKNMNRSGRYYQEPLRPPFRKARLSYVASQKLGLPLYQGLMASLGTSFDYHLQLRPPCTNRKKVAVIRPATLRREWFAASRNPRPEYLQACLDHLKGAGFHTVVVADLCSGQEYYDGSRPAGAHQYYEYGELGLWPLLNLVHSAALVVAGVGFMVPLCIALGTPALILHGGAGGWNAPEIINCPGAGAVTHVLPPAYCRCQDHHHACNKTIPAAQLRAALSTLVPDALITPKT